MDFSKISRPSFAAKPSNASPDVPAPMRGRALRRRLIAFKEASELLPHLPGKAGEATHALMSGRYDLCVLLAAIVDHYANVGSCRSLTIATLAFSRRNIGELSQFLQSGKVECLTLLCSEFFRKHNEAEYAEALREVAKFPGRWRMAAARSHAKVICADFGQVKMVMEGSANLRTNSNIEQLTVVLDADLFGWHCRWITDLVDRHEKEAEASD